MKNKTVLVAFTSIAVFTTAMIGGYLLLQMLNSQDNQEVINSENSDYSVDNDEEKNSVDVSLRYAGYVTLLKDENIITLNFTNPSKARKSLKLDIVADIDGEDVVLATTDMLRPGNKIDEIKYNSERNIPEGNYKGKFIVHFYDDQDQEEIVNSEIAINVYVK